MSVGEITATVVSILALTLTYKNNRAGNKTTEKANDGNNAIAAGRLNLDEFESLRRAALEDAKAARDEAAACRAELGDVERKLDELTRRFDEEGAARRSAERRAEAAEQRADAAEAEVRQLERRVQQLEAAMAAGGVPIPATDT